MQNEPRPKLVLIGNGMAGIRALEELLALAPDLYDVTVFGDEAHGNYNRILLSPVLSGEKTFQEIVINDRAWYEENSVTLHAGDPVLSIDRARREVVARSGKRVAYDRLILATGSKPIVLPVAGAELEGVVTFRDIRDVESMLGAARDHERAVVIGGGLLGLEAAYGLKARGMHVTVVHLLDSLMEKQLDPIAGALLRSSLEERGLSFRMEARTKRLLGEDRVTGVAFEDGREVAADLVVMAVGIRPNIGLAESCGLQVERGVLVNDTMQTYDPRIYAVGECVQHRGSTFGLVAPLYEQGKVVANQLAEDGYFQYRASTSATRLKVTGIDMFSAGDFHGGDDTEEVILNDARRGIYKKLVLRDERLVGVVLYGDTADGAWYLSLMRAGEPVGALRDTLILGRAFAEAGGSGGSLDVADLPDDTQICDCNGVCKGAIVSTIRERGLTTLPDVMAHTKAGASCGGCSAEVEALVQATLGDGYQRQEVQPVCGCTDLGHDEVRAFIAEELVTEMSVAMRAMGWRSPDGCARCRPALNYYLLCALPEEYEDDAQARFIGERVHANIQKDGTYSVVPRIFGGVTTPAQLRALAEVAESFDVPTVKITGGQRIDLLGVPKETLPAMWAELGRHGFISGHAYAKGVRTVKTCVGSEWCRHGVQDSTAMGIELEEMTWGSWAPHKYKLAVSGCPRNCAEATIKDFGVVAIDSGWELWVGGNGGMTVRAAELLGKVTTDREVLEYAGAFLQLYREEARYGERSAPFVERVGLDYVKERIPKDPTGRKLLFERFVESQRAAQVDPWAARVAGAEAHEFVPLARLTKGAVA